MSICNALVFLLIIYFSQAEEVKVKSKSNKENKVLTLRTVRDIEENLMYNELKHSNTHTYFDEVNFTFFKYLIFL